MKLFRSVSPRLPMGRRFDHYMLVLCFVLVVPQLLSGLMAPSSLNIVPVASAWEWTDYIVGGDKDEDGVGRRKTLSDIEISDLRVRDLKRRLARSHGYSAEDLGRMLDKKDLMAALSKEETKLRIKYRNEQRRKMFWRGLFIAIMCVVAVVGWPLWVQVSEVAAVNWQVYYDRKRHEISQCIEFRSIKGAIGVILLGVLDGLRFWLSSTVLLSWFLSSDSPYRRYMFPIPSLPIRPGQFMGEKVANGPLGRYGMNLAPMAITWCMGFVRGKVEYWTGNQLSAAARIRRKEARSGETGEDRKARKAARKAAKRAKREEQERMQQERWKEETERRKEMAKRASEQLFGNGTSERQTQSEQEESSQQQDDSTMSNKDYDNAKREFEADMEDYDDMNDLD